MNKPTIYLETTVVGHLAARQQSDIIVAARQLATHVWWRRRHEYEVFVSQIVLDECGSGDPTAASERLEMIRGIMVLDAKPEADDLAMLLTAHHGIPETEPRDALHIAIAAVGGLQYLLTWNFRHIANPATRGVIEDICRGAGYTPPIICSPDELLGT
ncbi:MAG: type II toxin-antitoxin system VapC family toxin [Pirellulaceae bacterium]